MTLKLIGPFGLFGRNGTRIEITSRKGRALIALLALAPGGSRGRTWLQTMLWGSRFREQAQASLRRELATLCSVLEERGAGTLIDRTTNWISLDLDMVDVDVLWLGLALQDPTRSLEGAFLEDVSLADCPDFEDWLQAQRSRVEDLRKIGIPSGMVAPELVVEGLSWPAARMLHEHPPVLPPKPSVCVLPFRLVGPGDAFAGQGIAEELGMTLARFPSLFVVATPPPGFERENGWSSVEIARRLGVRYLVRGTVMMDIGRIRVAVQVVDGGGGHQLWTQCHDGLTDDMFALQQRIAMSVAPQIHTQIDVTELRGALVDAIGSGDAYSLYWRANALFRQWTRDSIAEATVICERLVALQPSGSWGAAMAAFCHALAFASGWASDPAESRRTAVRYYQQAMRHGGEDPVVLGYAAGTLISIGGDIEVAEGLIAHALSLLPSYQPTLFWGGWVDLARGNPDRARERFEHSLRINPAAGVRPYAITGIGLSYLMKGQAAEAYVFLREAYQFIPDYPVTLVGFCVAAALSGQAGEANDAADRVRETNALAAVMMILRDPLQRALLEEGLRGFQAP